MKAQRVNNLLFRSRTIILDISTEWQQLVNNLFNSFIEADNGINTRNIKAILFNTLLRIRTKDNMRDIK